MIKQGDAFVCINTVVMDENPNDIAYNKGRIYYSEMRRLWSMLISVFLKIKSYDSITPRMDRRQGRTATNGRRSNCAY